MGQDDRATWGRAATRELMHDSSQRETRRAVNGYEIISASSCMRINNVARAVGKKLMTFLGLADTSKLATAPPSAVTDVDSVDPVHWALMKLVTSDWESTYPRWSGESCGVEGYIGVVRQEPPTISERPIDGGSSYAVW